MMRSTVAAPTSDDRPAFRFPLSAFPRPTISPFPRFGVSASQQRSILAFQRFSVSAFATAAFTLIEMIVVILIIATLAAILLTGASSMIERSKRLQAKNDVTQIVTAVNAFYTEYGAYPATSGPDTVYGQSGTASSALFNTLRAVTTTVNTRGIVFLSPRNAPGTAGNPRGGISQVTATAGQYFDPWGSPYSIVIDTAYDNGVANPYLDSDGSAGPRPTLPFGVIAYSYGRNGRLGGGPAAAGFSSESGAAGVFKASGDVLSWQ